MRKIMALAIVLGLMGGGCAWLGMGDDESTVTQTEEAQAAEPAAEAKEAVKSEAPATKKTTKKTAAKKGAKSEAQIQEELDKKGKQLAAQASRTLLPNISHKEVKKVGSHWVATYIHVDSNSVRTEMKPGASGQYVGYIRYTEDIMECKGNTREAALKAPCERARISKRTELIRYDGKEWQD